MKLNGFMIALKLKELLSFFYGRGIKDVFSFFYSFEAAFNLGAIWRKVHDLILKSRH
jgi:hypothetical protein